jgi:hypothetical protein
MAGLNLAAAAAWHLHARGLGERTGLSFGMADKLFDPAIVFTPAFPAWILDRLFVDVLGPVAFIAAAVGLWLSLRARRWFEVLGTAGFAIYLVLVAWGNFHHDYYQLAIVPVASAAAASGLIWLADRFGGADSSRRDAFLAGLLAFAAVSTFVRSASAHSWYEVRPESIETCRMIREMTTPDDRVVFIGEENPQMLFCIDRKGWLLSADDATAARVEEVWRAGARIAVVPSVFDRDETLTFLAGHGHRQLERPSIGVHQFRPREP